MSTKYSTWVSGPAIPGSLRGYVKGTAIKVGVICNDMESRTIFFSDWQRE